MTAVPLSLGLIRFFDPNTGKPVACGEVAAYEGGTLSTTKTPKDTWSDKGQTILNSNPVPLNNSGAAFMFGVGVYDLEVFDACGTPVQTYENVGFNDTSTPDSALPDLNLGT